MPLLSPGSVLTMYCESCGLTFLYLREFSYVLKMVLSTVDTLRLGVVHKEEKKPVLHAA